MQRKITPGHRRGAKHPPAAIVLEDGRCGLGTPLPHPDFLISDNLVAEGKESDHVLGRIVCFAGDYGQRVHGQ
jgi:hypothetical protein